MSTRRAYRLVVAFAIVSGVLSAPPVLAAPKQDAPRKKLRGPTRPVFSDVRELDYASLPLMKPRRLISGAEESFSIHALEDRSDVTPFGPPEHHVFFVSRDANIRVGTTALVPGEDVYAGYKTLAVDGPAEWFVVDTSQSWREGAMLRRYEGLFKSQVARARRADEVRAIALLPGELFAFRRCVARCDDPDLEAHESEEIGIVAQRAEWSGVSDALTDPRGESGKPNYTIRTAEISRGSSASLSVIIEPRSKGAPMRAIDVNVVWVDGSDPDLTLYVGSQQGTPTDVAPR